MSRKKRYNQRGGKPSHISKASEPTKNTTTSQRASKKQISSAGINAIKWVVEQLKPFELSQGQRLKTYQSMYLDDAVFSSIDSRLTAIETAQSNGKFRYDVNSPESIKIKEFLEYTMESLVDQTPRSIGRSAAEMILNSWSPFEVVYWKGDDDEFDGMFKLKKLAYIHPLSLDQTKPYETDDTGNSIVTLRQSATAFTNSGGTYNGLGRAWTGIKEIPYNRVCSVSYSGTSSQPLGTSPLDAAYVAWREKQLLQDYMTIGVTRDLAGTPVLRLPADVLAAADADSTSPEALQVQTLTSGMANMHSGDASYVVLPSDTHDDSSSVREYEIQFLGVEGNGKSFDLPAIIEQKKRAIYSTLASQHLTTGDNSGGSYNLLEGQVSMQALTVGRDCQVIDEMWNKQVFPKLLELNGWKYKKSDMPKWESGDVQPLSVEEFSKGIQRCKSFLPIKPVVINQILKGIGIDFEVDSNMTTEELREILSDVPDNSGEGDGTSGTGDSQTGGQGSAVNSDNAS